jgi:hypothetical protein
MFKKKWKPSKSKAREFAMKMDKVTEFCNENNITASKSNDSYYFTLNGKNYRVSNHTIEKSNSAAFDADTDFQKRELYHDTKRDDSTVYIHAGKTRIIEIYNDLKAGYELDGKGYKVTKK